MSGTKQIIVLDPDQKRPRKRISRTEIAEVVKKHQQLRALCRSALERAWEIGAKLRYWHDLIPHGQWLPFLKQDVPEIPERTARVYMTLSDHKAAILAYLKSADSADLDQQFTIKAALDFISSRLTQVEVKVEYKTRSITAVSYISPETTEIPVPRVENLQEADLREQSTSAVTELQDTIETAPEATIQSSPCPPGPRDDPEWFALTHEQLDQLCPDCRKLLEAIRES